MDANRDPFRHSGFNSCTDRSCDFHPLIHAHYLGNTYSRDRQLLHFTPGRAVRAKSSWRVAPSTPVEPELLERPSSVSKGSVRPA